MKMRRFILSAGLLLALLPCSLRAQDSIEPEGVDAVAMQFASWVRNPVDMAFGGIRVGDFNSFEMAWGSVGASVMAPGNDELTMLGVDINGGMKVGEKLSLSLRFLHEYGTSYEWAGANGNGPYSQDVHRIFGFSFGYGLLENIKLHAGMKFLQQRFQSNDDFDNIMAVDLAASAVFGPVSASAGIENLGLGKVISANDEQFSIPAALHAEGAYYLDVENFRIDARAGAKYFLFGALSAGAGAGVSFNDLVSVRAGYCFGGDSPLPDYLSLGLGVHFWKAHLNAAYLIGEGLADGSVALSALFAF